MPSVVIEPREEDRDYEDYIARAEWDEYERHVKTEQEESKLVRTKRGAGRTSSNGKR